MEPASAASDDPARAVRTDSQGAARVLLELVRELCAELRPRGAVPAGIALDSMLERDLGLDSLARVELLLRVQRAFGVDLPEDTLARAATPGDLLEALRGAAPGGMPHAAPTVRPPIESADAEPLAARTLLEVLDWHALHAPERVQIVHLAEGLERPITGADLVQSAARVAAGLQARGVEPGHTVAIMLPTGPDYFGVYLGILRAGAIPVPIYPPAHPAQLEEHVRRHVGILRNARAVLLVTVAPARAVGRLLKAHVPSIRAIATPDELSTTDSALHPVSPSADDVAFIQYTSGTTGDPKGVVLTHANLLANVRAMGAAIGVRRDDVFVSWLPLYHDMGLIGAWLGTMYFGVPLVVMSPLAFLARPVRWLRAIHAHRGTLSAAPNFAYELCARRIDDAELEGLDLGSWRWAFNGAEAVLPDTLERFIRRFEPHGLRREALAPVYGLAECSVGLAFPPPGRGPRIDRVARERFERGGEAVPARADDARALRFTGCGRPLPGHALRIVDARGEPLPERREGRLEFRGPSATRGYFDAPQATARLLRDGWLDSGDRAYLADGEVFVTGRVKDIVIRGGRNLHPHEIEDAVGELPGVRKGCVVAFGQADPGTGTERLVVLAETRETDAAARARLRDEVAARIVSVLGEPADAIEMVAPGTVLKTSSGKVRRAATRAAYESGAAGARVRGGRWQLARLAAGAAWPQLRRAGAHVGEWLFAARAWGVLAMLAPPAWLLLALSRRPARAWAIAGTASRLLLRATGTPVRATGLEHVPRSGPVVLVVNHASYLDAIVLAAMLPRPLAVLAKRELRERWITRVPLQRLGCAFVERFDVRASVQDAGCVEALLRDGQPLGVYPEGTFGATPGLAPFHLGAFLAAARTHAPVVPVAVSGTRAMLRAGSWRPRRGEVGFAVGAPLRGADGPSDPFARAIVLRDAARAHIAAHCGEPDLQSPG